MKTAEVNINNIYLMMGFACNFKCRYCLQTESKCVMPTSVSEKVYDYINHLVAIRSKTQQKLKIFFWGGEPLVYKHIIKQVVERLKDTVEYNIVTNGGLLDDDFVEYANANSISVVLSYDGKNTDKTRGKDMLKDKAFVERFRRLTNKGTLGVFSAYNYDFIENRNNEFPYNEEMLKITWDMPEDIYAVPLDKWEEKLTLMANKALNDMRSFTYSDEVDYFSNDVNRLLSAILNEEQNNIPNCRQVYTTMNIDLQGNVYVCHNCGDILGTVEDERIDIVDNYDKWLLDHEYQECKICRYYPMCKGGCPIEIEHKHKTCAMRKIYYKVVEELTRQYTMSLMEVDLNEY